jgi:hypothetical protein
VSLGLGQSVICSSTRFSILSLAAETSFMVLKAGRPTWNTARSGGPLKKSGNRAHKRPSSQSRVSLATDLARKKIISQRIIFCANFHEDYLTHTWPNSAYWHRDTVLCIANNWPIAYAWLHVRVFHRRSTKQTLTKRSTGHRRV